MSGRVDLWTRWALNLTGRDRARGGVDGVRVSVTVGTTRPQRF